MRIERKKTRDFGRNMTGWEAARKTEQQQEDLGQDGNESEFNMKIDYSEENLINSKFVSLWILPGRAPVWRRPGLRSPGGRGPVSGEDGQGLGGLQGQVGEGGGVPQATGGEKTCER